MKKIALSTVLFLLAGAIASAQSAEEIIEKHLKATGGEHWKTVNSIKMEATIKAESSGGMIIGWTMAAMRDKAVRMEVSVMGMTQISVVTGDKGWSTNPFMGKPDPEPMPADQVKALANMTDIDGTLVGYKEKGYTVEYVGKDSVNGKEALKIKINKSGKEVEYSLFDPETYYEIKNIQVKEEDGKAMETSVTFSNFKTQDNIVFPFTMQQSDPNMGNSSINFTSITLNPAVDEKIFEMPAKK